MELECGYCGRALEFERLPPTLVAQCGFCKKALDLAPVASQLTAPPSTAANAPALEPQPAIAPGTALHLAIAAEAGVRVERGADGALLRLRAGTGFHPTVSGLALLPAFAGFALAAEFHAPRLGVAALCIPAAVVLVAFLFGRWRIRLTPTELIRTHWPLVGRELRLARERAKTASVVASTYESDDNVIHLFSVVVRVNDTGAEVAIAPYLRNASAAAVVEREINGWIRGRAPSVEFRP